MDKVCTIHTCIELANTHVHTKMHACPESVHSCDMQDICGALKLWVTCTVYCKAQNFRKYAVIICHLLSFQFPIQFHLSLH